MKLALDSSVLVAAFQKNEIHHRDSFLLFEKIVQGEHRGVAPWSVWVEVRAAIARRTRSSKLAEEIANKLLVLDHLQFQEIHQVFAVRAGELASEIFLSGMDALVVETARQENATLVTLDREMARKAREVVKTLTPSDLLS